MVRKILKFGNPVLREQCTEVTEFDDKLGKTLDDMYDTMVKADGVGLAAPQIGITKRIVVIDIGKKRIELINPVIISMWGKQFEPEGCLSLAGKRGIVRRPSHIKVRAFNRYGKPVKYRAKDLLARAFCHEIDHLDGILYEDKVIEWVEEEED